MKPGRRWFVAMCLSPQGRFALLLAVFSLFLKTEEVDRAEAATLPPTKAMWDKGRDPKYVIITGAAPNEMVGSVLKRSGFKVKTAWAYEEPNYVLQVQRDRKKLRSKFWRRDGDEWSPREGSACLTVEFLERDAETGEWVHVASSITAILDSRAKEGWAIRLVQSGFDYSRVDNAHWSIPRRLWERTKVQARLIVSQLRTA